MLTNESEVGLKRPTNEVSVVPMLCNGTSEVPGQRQFRAVDYAGSSGGLRRMIRRIMPVAPAIRSMVHT